MKGFWFLLSLIGAALWFSFAAGFLEYQPWLVTVAFCLVGLNSVTEALKALAD